MGQNLSLVIAIGVPVLQGGLIGYLSSDGVQTWYKKLKKPKWTPPNWLFGPVWTALYSCMGTASWLVWKKGGFAAQMKPLALYSAQLTLNFLWSPIFFIGHMPSLAFVDIAALDVVLAATIAAFFKQNKTAGYLLLPYMAWSLYATALTAKIARDNPQGTENKESAKETPETQAEQKSQ